MSWNHRVVRTKHPIGATTQTRLAIHEVYYDDLSGKPIGCTEDPIIFDAWLEGADDTDATALESLRWQLTRMMEAMLKPILDEDDFEWDTKKKV